MLLFLASSTYIYFTHPKRTNTSATLLMKYWRYELKIEDIKEVANAVSAEMERNYEKETATMIVISEERYKLRTNSAQLNQVIITKKESTCEVDIMGAAGGTGIFNFSLWSESGFIWKTSKVLKSYCEQNGIEILKELKYS